MYDEMGRRLPALLCVSPDAVGLFGLEVGVFVMTTARRYRVWHVLVVLRRIRIRVCLVFPK